MNLNQMLLERLARVECPDATGVIKNYTPVFAKGQASYLFDAAGKEYIDLCASFGSLALGHNSENFQKFLASYQEGQGLSAGFGDLFPSVAKIELLEYLVALTPSFLSKAALMVSGGQSVEFALKTAFLATKRSGFLTFRQGYHGLDLGILPLCRFQKFRAPFEPWVNDSHVVEVEYGCSQEALDQALCLLKKKKLGCAAVVVEPIQGRAGVRFPAGGWLQMLSEWCQKEGVKLILDEIFTGLGRIGTLSSSEVVSCDMICLGKILGGGLPISACVGRAEMMDAWPEAQGEALHTGTFFGHALNAAWANTVLKYVSKPVFLSSVQEKGDSFLQRLRKSLQHLPQIQGIRGQGLMMAIEFVKFGQGLEVFKKLLDHGVVALPSGARGAVISFSPALNIDEKVLNIAGDRIVQVISQNISG